MTLSVQRVKKDEEWKINSIYKYFMYSVLTVFVNDALNCSIFTQIAKIFIEKFIKTDTLLFFNLKLESVYNLENYYHKKVYFGMKLGRSESFSTVSISLIH